MAQPVRNSRMVEQVIARLKTHDRFPQAHDPYLIERVIRETRAVHLTGIWDAWSKLDFASKSEVLTIAYAEAGRHPTFRLTIAVGYTVDEAKSMGLLPYAVVPTSRSSGRIKAAAISKGLRDLDSGFYLGRPSRGELRFHTEEEAEDAYLALSKKFGGKPVWAITKEVWMPSDS
jgi:hypothetical protein